MIFSSWQGRAGQPRGRGTGRGDGTPAGRRGASARSSAPTGWEPGTPVPEPGGRRGEEKAYKNEKRGHSTGSATDLREGKGAIAKTKHTNPSKHPHLLK